MVGVGVGTGTRAIHHLYFLKHQPVSLMGNGYCRGKIRRLAIRDAKSVWGWGGNKDYLDYR